MIAVDNVCEKKDTVSKWDSSALRSLLLTGCRSNEPNRRKNKTGRQTFGTSGNIVSCRLVVISRVIWMMISSGSDSHHSQWKPLKELRVPQ